jgi:hypothetical protein
MASLTAFAIWLVRSVLANSVAIRLLRSASVPIGHLLVDAARLLEYSRAVVQEEYCGDHPLFGM